MQNDVLERLTQPFGADALEWRILDLSSAETDAVPQARVRPQLKLASVTARLNEVLGINGWSNRYTPLGAGAVACELSLGDVTKTGVTAFNDHASDKTRAEDAFVVTAELFGLMPPADIEASYWVDYDPENRVILHEPVLGPIDSATPPTPLSTKPAGQQAIDKLVERLRENGQGLAVAKLVTTYGGYGQDADTARELYSKLRELLLEETAPA